MKRVDHPDDLLGAKVLTKDRVHQRPLRCRELRVAARDPASMIRVRLRLPRPVRAAIFAPDIPTQLATDGTGVAAQGARDRGLRLPLPAEQRQRLRFVGRDLGVRHGVLSLGRELKPSVAQVISPASGPAHFVAVTM